MLCSPYVLAEGTEAAMSACALTGWVTDFAVCTLVKELGKCPACQGPCCRRACSHLSFGESTSQQENVGVITGYSHLLVSRSLCGAHKHLSCTLTVTGVCVCWITVMLCFLLLGALLLKSKLPGSPLSSKHLVSKTPNTEILALCVDDSGLGTRQPTEQSPPISGMMMVVCCFLCLHEKNFS